MLLARVLTVWPNAATGVTGCGEASVVAADACSQLRGVVGQGDPNGRVLVTAQDDFPFVLDNTFTLCEGNITTSFRENAFAKMGYDREVGDDVSCQLLG